MKGFEGVFQSILRHSRLVIIVFLLVTAGAALRIPRIKLDNSVDAFFNEKSRNYTAFQEWKEQFGSDTVVVVAFSDRDIFTQTNLELIDRLTRKFESIEHVDTVTSLTTVNDVIGSDQDFIVEPLIKRVPADAASLAELKRRAVNNPLYAKNVISADATTTAFIIELEHAKDPRNDFKKTTISKLRDILRSDFPKGRDHYISGQAAIEYFYVTYIQGDLKLFMPLMMLVVVIVLFLSFRSIVGIVLPMIVTTITLIWTMAFLQLCGFSINSVTTTLPPIMLSITLLETIHFIWEMKEKRKERLDDSGNDGILLAAMRNLFFPCILTNLTTVIGFFSLLVSTVPPLRQLGLVAGVGVFFSFIIAFTLLPALIKHYDLISRLTRKTAIEGGMDAYAYAFLKWIAGVCIKAKYPILILSIVLLAASVWGTFKIKTETSILEFFRKSSPIYAATMFIEKHLSGVHSLNISLKARDVDYFKDPRALRKIEALQEFLFSIPQVDKSTSVVDYLKEINQSFHGEDPKQYTVPDAKDLVAQYVLLYGADDLDDFVDSQWQWTTVRVRLKEHSTHELKKVMDRIRQYLKNNGSADTTAEIVGHTVLEVDANDAVTSGQVQSLGLAMILIFGIMFLDFRSFSVGMVSIIPNIMPLLMNFGIMGFGGIRLDSATAMISDIGIGIIVDDTVHFLHAAGETAKKTGDYTKAMITALLTKGTPTFITTVILILGFGVVSFSKFVPTFYFGALSALLMLNGLLIEIFLTPALILIVKPKFK